MHNSFGLTNYFTLILYTVVLTGSVGVSAQKVRPITISIENTSNENVSNKVIEISWTEIIKHQPLIDTNQLIVVDQLLKQLAYQLESKGTDSIQNLLVQVSVPAHKKIILQLKCGKKQAFISKTYCRYVPERYDDFAWENDRMAFRMYGKALEATTFNGYGIDVWAKRTSNLVIDKWYKSEDYHKDHGEGLDFYGVGFSLGAGDCAPYWNDSIYFPKNYDSYKVFGNGPLRSSFQLLYNAWKVGKYNITLKKIITLNAGEQLNRVEATFNFDGIDSLPIVIGINKQKGADIKILNEQERFMAYWLPKDSVNGTIGIGTVGTGTRQEMTYRNKHLLSLQSVKSGTPLVYYTGATWDKAGYFTSANAWSSYLQLFAKQVRNNLKISVN